MLGNTEADYGLVSKALHWLIAAGIVGLVWLGWWMVDLGYYDRWYNRSLSLHRSFGMALLGLAVIFAAWKVVSPSPPLQNELTPWETSAAWVVHGVLLAAMFAVPLSGYLISTSAGAGVPIFGWIDVPALLPKSEAMRDFAVSFHYYAAYGLVAVVALHAGAALKHEFVDNHGTLKRML